MKGESKSLDAKAEVRDDRPPAKGSRADGAIDDGLFIQAGCGVEVRKNCPSATRSRPPVVVQGDKLLTSPK